MFEESDFKSVIAPLREKYERVRDGICKCLHDGGCWGEGESCFVLAGWLRVDVSASSVDARHNVAKNKVPPMEFGGGGMD